MYKIIKNINLEKIGIDFLGHEIITLKKWGKEPYDAILLCQHGYQSECFLKKFPFLKDLFDGMNDDEISEYIELEHDADIRKTTNSLALKLVAKAKSVALIEINIDRGIVDPNRVEEHCLRGFWDMEKFPEQKEFLLNANKTIRNFVFEFTKNNLRRDGFFADIHSMWSYNHIIPPSTFEGKKDIKKYCDLIYSPANQGDLRSINFLTHNGKELVGSMYWESKLEKIFRDNKYPVEYNRPYQQDPKYAGYLYKKEFGGLSIDIPRRFLFAAEDRIKIVEMIASVFT